MSDKQQTVADPTESQTTESGQEGVGAQEPSLDDRISEFNDGISGQQQAPEQPQQADPRVDEVYAHMISQDVAAVIQEVRGDISQEIYDDEMVEGWLDRRVSKNPDLRNAWVNRHANPGGFGKIVAGLRDELKGRVAKLPNQEVTADREALSAAVRGASTPVAEEKQENFAAMSDAELDQWKMRHGKSAF